MSSGIQFEMQRRVIFFTKNTTMPDGSQLGFEGNPNTIVLTGSNTDGELLLYNAPKFTHYGQENGDLWVKKTTWEKQANFSELPENQMLTTFINSGNDIIDTFEDISIEGVHYKYLVSDGINKRSGNIMVIIDYVNNEGNLSDVSTGSIGDTGNIKFDVEVSVDKFTLKSVGTGDFMIKIFKTLFK